MEVQVFQQLLVLQVLVAQMVQQEQPELKDQVKLVVQAVQVDHLVLQETLVHQVYLTLLVLLVQEVLMVPQAPRVLQDQVIQVVQVVQQDLLVQQVLQV